MDVWCVWHVDERDFSAGDVKFIGVYDSPEEAYEAVERLRLKPGFRDTSDGFHVSRYEMNRDYWADGFEAGPGAVSRNLRAKQSVLTVVRHLERQR